ncbi:hypothetical protein E9549_14840 [Blastococcus sp. MG754426]|uniref:hypothetical protein n=1 Tax=unclassified Blastococcus TaxID=2619396 RepID=UPI001EEFD84D|nr:MULTISPECIES: hypothetical protein [unclassified Blastococcus]MCF6508672.1 hypothetical protein [Blastococcus sp. MG754426]MCF6513299.1 hypothetical protein [Blastococcus sp. MG754427]
MSPRRTAAAVLLLALPLAGCAGTAAPAVEAAAPAAADSPAAGSTTPTDPAPTEAAGRRIEVAYADGRVTGDTGRVPVPLGEPVTVVVTSDVADEAHLHGYDELANLVPGQPAELAFDATIPGVFELELHDAGTVLLTLQVG